MKLFKRALTVTAAAVLLTGLAMAQDETAPYAPPPIDYNQPAPMPSAPPPPPPKVQLPEGLPVGPMVITPTYPPGVKGTIHF